MLAFYPCAQKIERKELEYLKTNVLMDRRDGLALKVNLKIFLRMGLRCTRSAIRDLTSKQIGVSNQYVVNKKIKGKEKWL